MWIVYLKLYVFTVPNVIDRNAENKMSSKQGVHKW